jgi:hypothetical protein
LLPYDETRATLRQGMARMGKEEEKERKKERERRQTASSDK